MFSTIGLAFRHVLPALDGIADAPHNLDFEQDIHVGVVRKVFEGWVQESS
jgi:hypothetical protein